MIIVRGLLSLYYFLNNTCSVVKCKKKMYIFIINSCLSLKILESVLSFILIYIFIDRGSKAESFPTDQTDNRGAEG